MGRDKGRMLPEYEVRSFNPRARMGRDSSGACFLVRFWMFQPTRPHGARLFKVRVLDLLFCFNPRARMGRDLQSPQFKLLKEVSTHAPAWGATIKAI